MNWTKQTKKGDKTQTTFHRKGSEKGDEEDQKEPSLFLYDLDPSSHTDGEVQKYKQSKNKKTEE